MSGTVDDLRARVHGLTAAFDAGLHPRGKDGKFIEKFGKVELFGKVGGFGRKTDVTGQRGEVVDIIPDRKGGQPTIRVKVTGKDGREGTIDVTPDQVAQAPEKARLDAPAGAPAATRPTLDELRELDTPALQAIIDDPNSGPDAIADAVKIRNNRQNAAAIAQRPAATPGDIDSAKKTMTDLATSKDVRDAVDLARVQGIGGQSKVRDVEAASQALETADATNIKQRADALVTALERLRADLRQQQGMPGGTIGQEFRGIEMSSDRIKIQALERAVQEARRRASSITASGHDDADVMIRWLQALHEPEPDVTLIASLEATADRRGWNPTRVLDVIVAARGSFSADLHPRGRDGKFIEKLGLVELFDLKTAPAGQRGQVTKITPDPTRPGKPNIEVRLLDRNGKPGRTVRVKPNNIQQAPEKARIDRPGPNDRFDEPRRFEPPPETPEQRQRRQADQAARQAPDDELEAGPGASEPWRQAVEKEKANRVAYRAQQEQARQKLIADVNAAAANLSTTDPQARAEGLDDILAKLRFSIIDTDKVHDHIYPPGESGRWTPERAAVHEEMWNELLANVEAAGIPKDHDAFVLGGLPGAGKSYSLRPGQKADQFGVRAWETNAPPLEGGATHVSINPDIVKEMLIDRGLLPEGISPDLKPMEQVTFLHEESSYLAKVFSKRLGDEGYNIVLDNTFDSEGGMLKRMTPLAREGYSFRGLFVDIPVDESIASAKKRYLDGALSERGGRFVPSSVQGNRTSTQGNLSKNRDAFDNMVGQDWFKDYMVIDNTGVTQRTPKSEVVDQGSGGGTAADRYLPDHDAAVPKAGPKLPDAPEAPPTIVV